MEQKYPGQESTHPAATGGSVRVVAGKVQVTDSDGQQLLSDLDNGMLYYPQGDG